MKHNTSITRTLLRILFSALLLSGLTFGNIFLYRKLHRARGTDFHVPIRAIVQTGPIKEALKTAYLAELLGLSVDQPTLTSDFDTKEGAMRLQASPVIKDAEVQILEPGIVYIEYVTRNPVALLADYENIALDSEGFPFPLTPFFSQRKLPEVYLDLEDEIQFNQPIEGEKKELAFELIELVSGLIVSDLHVVRIDVSNAFKQSYGRREIVLEAKDVFFFPIKDREVCFHFPQLIRLSTKKYLQDLSNYLELRQQLIEKERRKLKFTEEGVVDVTFKEKIIDLRIPQLAFIDEGDG
jgi:hypothetical protein